MNFKYTQNPNFTQRYVAPEKLFFYLQSNYGDYMREIGRSSQDRPIYCFTFGVGNLKVVAWSQMHGNESTATLAMLDFLYIIDQNKELKSFFENHLSLDFVFMLNPDGSQLWQRRNFLNIDLNRDFNQEASVEMQLFKKFLHKKFYDYALNLHDQRSIFTTDGMHPATLSFLAPSENASREITENRKKSMAVIAKIYDDLKEELPSQIGRYSDEFYPNSVGDNLMKAGVPTILFEGGHFQDDYYRKETRKFYTKALFQAFLAMIELRGNCSDYDQYFNIPENQESHYDIIYRNVRLNTDFPCELDIAVQFREEFHSGDEITFTPIVVEVGDVGRKKAWKEIDCSGKFFKCENKFPKLDAIQNFEII